MGPTNASQLATLIPPPSGSSAVIATAQSAAYYQLVGLEITTPRYLAGLVSLGSCTVSGGTEGCSETSWQQLPHHIIFDRCYIHGSSTYGTRRGILANAGQGNCSTTRTACGTAYYTGFGSASRPDDIVVTNSYFADIKDSTYEAQAFESWNGYGPFRLENNYLESSTENVMFGGEDPSVPYLVPSDIIFRHNHCYKPMAWFNGNEAGKWISKNLFELKNAQNVVVDSNVFEHNWVGNQRGYGFVLIPRNQSGASPWSIVQNVTFTNNVIRHMAGGITTAGSDSTHPSRQLNQVTYSNNLFYDIGGIWGPSTDQDVGQVLEIEYDTDHFTFDHNTAFQTTAVTYSNYTPNTNFVFTNNVAAHNYCGAGNDCGMSGASSTPGCPALAAYFGETCTTQVAQPLIQNNLLYSGDEAGLYSYPPAVPGWQGTITPPSASFNADYTLNSPQYFDSAGHLLGIDSSVIPGTANVVQYCTSSGAPCSSNLDTTTSVSSNVNPSTYGQPVTFTATVSPSGATGTATFSVDGTAVSTQTISGGAAAFSTSTLSAGTHSITATYNGDSNYNGSISAALSQTVNKAGTSTNLTSSLNPSNSGQSVAFTVTVSPSSATGTVTFFVDGTAASTQTINGGAAVFSTSALSAGTHSITATYNGDSNYNGSASNTVSQTVNAVSADFSITASPSSRVVKQGGTAQYTMTITGSGGFSGTVSFSVSPLAGSFRPVTVTGSGSTTLSIPNVAKGSYTLTITGTSGSQSHSSAVILKVHN